MLMLYALDKSPDFGASLADCLGVSLAPHEDCSFEDGERKLRPLSDPRGSDAYVLLSLYGGPDGSPQDKLLCLLMFISALRGHGAARVTAVIPYLAYTRKDRQSQPFDPVTLRYLAQWMEASGAAQLIVLEAQNVSAFQTAFRCPTQHLEAHHAFARLAQTWCPSSTGTQTLVVASPDPGGVKRAQLWRESLVRALSRPVGFAMLDKRRSAAGVGSEDLVTGDVEGSVVYLLDDRVASGRTLQRAARALIQAGAAKVLAFAAHGLFTGSAVDVLADSALAGIAVTDSVPSFRLPANSAVRAKLSIVSIVPAFAQAIAMSHEAWRHKR